MTDRRARKGRRFWGPRRWHRYLGALFALPLLWLCVTGLLLQHHDDWGLNEKEVTSEWLLKRYGQIPEGEPRVVTAGRFTIAEWDEVLFLDDRILEESGVLVGAVAKPAEVVVATAGELFVFGPQGEYLDRLGEASLPALPIERLGLGPGGELLLKAGGGHYVMDDSYLSYEEGVPDGALQWSEVEEGGSDRSRLQAAVVEGAGFTWSRVITDLHSGSLFGAIGRFLVDLTGIGVIVVTLFGIRLLFKRS